MIQIYVFLWCFSPSISTKLLTSGHSSSLSRSTRLWPASSPLISRLTGSYWSKYLNIIHMVDKLTLWLQLNESYFAFFSRFSLIGWLLPLIPVILTTVAEHSNLNEKYKPQIGGEKCWFRGPYGLQFYFLLPIAIVFCANLIIYITLIARLALLAYETRKAKTNHKEKLILSVKLFFAFGLLWLVGFLSAIFVHNENLKCGFLILNGLNGVFLFIVFICTKAFFNLLFRNRGVTRRYSSSRTATSSVKL